MSLKLLIFFTIFTSMHILVVNAASVDIDKTEVCVTPECVKSAKEIFEKIDYTVDACDDFYRFACGQFIKTTEIPDDKVSVNAFSLTDDNLQEQLKTLVESPVENNDIEPFKMVKKLYSGCMNEELIERRGLNISMDILERHGGWPVIKGDQWNSESWTWQKSVFQCRETGYPINFILKLSVGADFKNSSKRIVYIDQPYFWLDRAILLKGIDDPVVEAYHSYQVDLAVIYGADKEIAKKEMMEALNFEIALANISLPLEKQRNSTELYNPITIRDLEKKHPYNDWLQYFNIILPAVSQVDKNEVIIVLDVKFFDQLGDLLRATPERTIANYLLWRVAETSTDFLTKQLRNRQLEYFSVLNGQKTDKPRWKECIDYVIDYLSIAMSSSYVRKYFDQESKKVALDMVNGIKEEYKEILSTVAWMDTKTREVAKIKANAIFSHIGYADELLNNEKLIEYYKELNVDENKFFESIFGSKVFQADLNYKKLREPVNKTDWRSHSYIVEVNAAYSPIENSMLFPAGILQGQFFSAGRPRYLNYAAIGFVIGHEITHGFDDEGRQFDLDGNLVDWWDKQTSESFQKKAQCIIDQYSNYTDAQTGLNLNGIITQGENIADNGGTKEAYLAYQNTLKIHGPEGTLPGLNYNQNQLFWITFAQTWCGVDRTETLKKLILTDVHSPNEFRVHGNLQNLKEFASDFQCPKGSKMNPIHKCEVW